MNGALIMMGQSLVSPQVKCMTPVEDVNESLISTAGAKIIVHILILFISSTGAQLGVRPARRPPSLTSAQLDVRPAWRVGNGASGSARSASPRLPSAVASQSPASRQAVSICRRLLASRQLPSTRRARAARRATDPAVRVFLIAIFTFGASVCIPLLDQNGRPPTFGRKARVRRERWG